SSSSSPSRVTVPASSSCAPAITLVSVDLPDPFSPTRAWMVPRRTRKETSSSARTVPKVLVTPSTWTARSAVSRPTASGRSVVIVAGVLRGHVDPRLVAVDDLVLDADRGVALDAEVGALFDGPAVEQSPRDHVLRVGGEAGVPELDHVDRSGLEEVHGVFRGRCADHADGVLEPGLLDGLADADHVGGGGALHTLEVRVGAQELLHTLVGLLRVVRGLDPIADKLHVRVLLLLVLLRRIDP